jgi:hypothetical protein
MAGEERRNALPNHGALRLRGKGARPCSAVEIALRGTFLNSAIAASVDLRRFPGFTVAQAHTLFGRGVVGRGILLGPTRPPLGLWT